MLLPQRIRIADVEDLGTELVSNIGSVDLAYPALLRGRGLGTEAAFVQFLLTWANISASRKLVLLDTMRPDEYAERLSERLTGRVAALLCTSAKRQRGSEEYTRLIKSVSERHVLGTYYNRHITRENVTGRSIVVLCADTAGFGEPRSVYHENINGSLEVKDLAAFQDIADSSFSAIIHDVYDRALTVDEDFVQATASLLFELFSNTHDHARSNLGGEPLQASCRGFQVRIVSGEDTSLMEAAAGYQPLTDYLSGLNVLQNRTRQMAEISVFDAGPGFAQQITKTPLDDLSPTREREAVDRCFARGVSTKSHRRYGQGLPQVISLLRQRQGFLRLRTGRLSLACDLGKEASLPREITPTFSEWSPPGRNSCSHAQGSCVTLLMPLEKRL
jgi:hypothetical protein